MSIPDMTEWPEARVKKVATSICRSRTCESFNCCAWPANSGRRAIHCPVKAGDYDDAARNALDASGLREAQQERDDYRSDYLRVHKDKCDLLEEKYAWQAERDAALARERELVEALADGVSLVGRLIAMGRWREIDEWKNKARAALARARGETP